MGTSYSKDDIPIVSKDNDIPHVEVSGETSFGKNDTPQIEVSGDITPAKLREITSQAKFLYEERKRIREQEEHEQKKKEQKNYEARKLAEDLEISKLLEEETRIATEKQIHLSEQKKKENWVKLEHKFIKDAMRCNTDSWISIDEYYGVDSEKWNNFIVTDGRRMDAYTDELYIYKKIEWRRE